MLKAFKSGSFEKAVLGSYSICNISRITPTPVVGSCDRFIQYHPIPAPPFCRFSSKLTKQLSTPSDTLRKLLKDDVNQNNEVNLSDSVINNKYDPPSRVLQSGERRKVKNILKVENIELLKELAEGDDEKFELLKELQVKLDISSCQYGVKVNITKEDWLDFLSVSTTKRKSFIAYLIINTIRSVKKHFENPPPLFDLPDSDEDDVITGDYDDVRCYHLFHNAMFMKLRNSAIKRMYYAKGVAALLFSSNLVFDCSYGDFMRRYEVKDLARQLNSCASINFKSDHPFSLMITNVREDDILRKYLKRMNPIIFSDEYPVMVTDKSYLDFFPKTQLVYLTPHCNTSLRNYDPDKTYIIGGFIDKTHKKPISLAKAKELEIPMARLPIDEFLDWGMGDKCLSLPHVTRILLDLKTFNGDWYKAFEAIPKRCLLKERPKSQKSGIGFEVKELFDSLYPA